MAACGYRFGANVAVRLAYLEAPRLRTSTPMLAGYWPNDPFGPEEDAGLIASSSAEGKLLPLAARPALANFERALNQVCDWPAKRLQQ